MEQEIPFVSEGDMIFAWWSQRVLSVLRSALQRTIVLLNVFDIRPTLSNDILPSNCAFVLPTPSFMHVRAFPPGALDSYCVSQLRCALEQQVEDLAALRERMIETTDRQHIIGDSNMILIVCTN